MSYILRDREIWVYFNALWESYATLLSKTLCLYVCSLSHWHWLPHHNLQGKVWWDNKMVINQLVLVKRPVIIKAPVHDRGRRSQWTAVICQHGRFCPIVCRSTKYSGRVMPSSGLLVFLLVLHANLKFRWVLQLYIHQRHLHLWRERPFIECFGLWMSIVLLPSC